MRARYTLTGIAASLALAVVLCAPSVGYAQSLEYMRSEVSALFDKGDFDKALPIIRDILKQSPSDSTAMRYMLIYNMELKEPQCRLAAAAFFDGDYKGAASHWQKVLDMDPSDTSVRSLINEALLMSNQDAIATLYASANRMIEAGRYNDATHELNKILDIDPNQSKARKTLEAISLSIEDSTISSLYSTASELRAKGEYDLAVEALERVLKLDPGQALAPDMITSTLLQKHRDIHRKAESLIRGGQYVRARDQLIRLVESIGDNSMVTGELERLKQVVALLPEATGQSPYMEAIRIGLFNYISASGSSELALAASAYAMELADRNEAAPKSINAFLEQKLGRLEINDDAPGSPGVLERYMLGALNNIYEGRYARAVEQCSIVLSLEDDNPLALKRLGSAYYLMGQKQKAATAWKEALAIEPDDHELREFVEMVTR